MHPVPLIGLFVFVGVLYLMVEGYRMQRKAMATQREAAERGRLSLQKQEEAAERGRLVLERQEKNIQRAEQQAAKSQALQEESVALGREMVALLQDINRKIDRTGQTPS